jgi:uncharacterized protein (TIGR02246 family)
MAVVRRDAVDRWVEGYEEAWRAPGTRRLAELFTPDVTYLPSPWGTPLHGLDALAAFWEAERAGPDEEFAMWSDVVAVDTDTAVVRVHVDYARPGAGSWRNLWVVRFAPGGRCAAFEEWPFAPRQDDGHPPGTEAPSD